MRDAWNPDSSDLKPRIAGTRLEVTGGFGRPPLERTPQVLGLYEMARDVSAAAWARRSAKGGREAGRTGISRPLWGFQH